MKTVSAAFLTMLQTSEFLVEADLYTITLQNGTVLRYTSAQLPFTYNGNTYDAAAAIQSVTAVAQPFFTGDGSTTSAHLVGPNGESITSAATVTAMHQTDWQGRLALSSQPRTNYFYGIIFNALTPTTGQPSPDGKTGATLAVPTTANALHYLAGNSPTTGAFVKLSCYAKAAGYNALFLEVQDPTSTYNVAKFDLSTGIATLTGGAPISYSMEPAPDGYYYCQITAYSGSTASPTSAFALVGQSGAFAGDGISGILLFGEMVTVAPDADKPAIAAGTYAPVTVTDYAVDSSGNVTLGQSPAVGATLDWDGTGSTGNYAPGFVRGSTKCAVGLESDDLEVDILFDTTTLLSGQNPAAFVAAGGLDNAVLRLDKALAPDWSNPVVNGVVNLFTGYIGETKCEQGKITLTVNSRVKILNTSFPRNYFLPQDNNALFSAASGLTQASYAVSGTVAAGSSRTVFTTNCTQADGWFALGSVVWKTGPNAGLTSFVKAYANASGTFTLVYPLAAQPAAGDTFTAYPGYDRTQATCQTKFNNVANFRGYPYVPTPETLELGQTGSPPQSIGGGGGAGVGGMGRGPGGQAGRLAQR